MKANLIALLLITTALSQPICAQSSFRVGLTGGLNVDLLHFSWMPAYHTTTNLWRYNAGVSFENRLTPTLTLAYDLLYSRQGGVEVITSPLGYGTDQNITKVDYLGIPIMLRYQPGGRRLFISAGPQLGYLLAAKTYTERFGEASAQFWNLQYTHRLDIGLTAGLGYRIGKHLIVSSRYYYSIRPINAGPYGEGSQKLYNRIWSTNLAYYF